MGSGYLVGLTRSRNKQACSDIAKRKGGLQPPLSCAKSRLALLRALFLGGLFLCSCGGLFLCSFFLGGFLYNFFLGDLFLGGLLLRCLLLRHSSSLENVATQLG